MSDQIDHGALDDLRSEVVELRGRIEAIRRKPWYREGGVIIAALALFVSVFALVLKERQVGQESEQRVREDLRSVLSEVQALRSEFHVKVDAVADPSKRERVASAINGRAFVLLEKATALVDEVPESEITTAEYSALGNLLLDFGRFDDAHRYLKEAAEQAVGPLEHAGTRKDVARVLYAKGSPEKGREEFAAAINFVADSTDPLSRFQVPFIHEVWGEMELLTGGKQLAAQHFVKAKEGYHALEPVYAEQARAGLERVTTRLRKLESDAKPVPAQPEAPAASGY